MIATVPIGTTGKHRVKLDLLKLIDTRLLVQASSGGGKSYLLRKIIEEAAPHVQVIVLDPEGEFGTLREKHDFLLIGDEGELRTEVRAASLLARRLAELKVSAVLDLYGLKLADRRAFVAEFLNALMNVPKLLWHDVLVFIDEAHIFAPEKKGHAGAVSLDAVTTLMTQGRKRGFCGLLATQRLSSLSKDVAAQAGNVLIGKTTLDVDLQRAGAVLGMGAKDRTELIHLSPGEFYGFGPAFTFDGVQSLRVGEVRTTHPRPGQRRKLIMPSPSKAIQGVLGEFTDLPEQAEQEIRNMEQAKARIAELNRTIESLRQQVTEPQNLEPLQAELARAQEQLEAQRRETDAVVGRFADYVRDIVERVAQAVALLQLPPAPDVEVTATLPKRLRAPRTMQTTTGAPPTIQPASGNGRTSLRSRILNAIAWWESAGVDTPSRNQVAFAACARPRSSHFANTISALRTDGSIDYPSSGCLALSEKGRRVAATPSRPATLAELHDRVRSILGAGLPLRIFNALAQHRELSREALAQTIDQSSRSSHFNNTISALRTSGVLTYPQQGSVRLSEAFEGLA